MQISNSSNSNNAKPLLHIENLNMQYVSTNEICIALYKINLQLNKGERLSIVGKSGCGKSTLLNAIAGFLPPTSGHIYLDGQVITKPNSERIVVFQEHGLLPWKDVLNNVTFPLIYARGLHKKEAEKQAKDALHLVGLQDLQDKFPHQLSGGQKQRVSIARAFAMKSKILLMDEPFSALDQMTKNTLQDELLNLCNKTHATVLFITHDIREAIKVGHRIVVLSANPGQVIADLDSRYTYGADAIEAQKNQIEKLLGL